MDKIDKLLQKRQELQSQIRDLKNKEKAKADKIMIRKHILIGRMVLESHEVSGTLPTLIKNLDKYLTKNIDRKLFNLPETEDAGVIV